MTRGLMVFAFAAVMLPRGFAQSPEPVPSAPVSIAALKAKQTSVVNKLRQLGLALFEFERDYDSFPNAETAKMVKENIGKEILLKTDTADDCFRQLVDTGFMNDDKILTMESPAADEPKQGEPAVDPRKKVAFAYSYGMSASGNPDRPLAFYPLLDGKTTFDPTPLCGKAVILFVDQNVRSFPIEKDGRVLIRGKDMFDPEQPYWGGKKPAIKWPAK